MILEPAAARAVKQAIDAAYPIWRQFGINADRDVAPESPPIIFVEIGGERNAIAAGSSRLCAQNARTFVSSAAIRRGVKTRARRLRWRVCAGGSSMMKLPGWIGMFALMSSINVPRDEM